MHTRPRPATAGGPGVGVGVPLWVEILSFWYRIVKLRDSSRSLQPRQPPALSQALAGHSFFTVVEKAR
jgi:hypothetical protein